MEQAARVLEPGKDKRETEKKSVQAYTDKFLDQLETAPAFIQSGFEDAMLNNTDFSAPTAMQDIMQLLEEHMENPGINTAHGGHLGYIPGGGLYTAALGDYLADVTNKYAGVFYASPGAVRIENALIEWTGKLIGYAKGFGGNITSGGSIANLIAITTARDAKKIKARDFERTVIYTTAQAHHCVDKAVIIAGLRECMMKDVAMDAQFRMDVHALEQQVIADREAGLLPFMVIANAGSTDVGAIDPLKQISDIAQAHNLWMHVDAAYGGYFMLLDECREKFDGIALADSVVLDPHKGMFLPYGTGIVLVKQVHHLQNAFAYEANYMQDTVSTGEVISPADVSPELSKHFRGMRMWLPLKLYGEQPFKDCLREKILLTQYFTEQIQQLGFEIVCRPELSVVAYRYIPHHGNANDFNKRLVEMMHEDGRIFISSTQLGDMYVLRFACLSFRTHLSHVDILLDMLKKHIEALMQSWQEN